MTSSVKRTFGVECEVPAGKRAVPDFGGEVAKFEEVMRAMKTGEIFLWKRQYCAAPFCTSKVLVDGCMCRHHVRKCADCECLLVTPSAIHFAQPGSPRGTFWRSSVHPPTFCGECIKRRTELPSYGDRDNKYPVVLVRAEIGATGTDVSTEVVAMSDNQACASCGCNLFRRAQNQKGDVGEIGGVLHCGDCVGINRVDCGPGVTIMGSMRMCTVAATEVNEYGALTGRQTNACLACKAWHCKCAE